ncbi:MAG: hypothetical protein Q6L60_02280 [Thermostichus sp. HHBFW_bins_43]
MTIPEKGTELHLGRLSSSVDRRLSQFYPQQLGSEPVSSSAPSPYRFTKASTGRELIGIQIQIGPRQSEVLQNLWGTTLPARSVL